MSKAKEVLLVLGGTWHKFDAFAADVGGLLTQRGGHVRTTRELESLARLSEGGCDLVMMYNCLSGTLEDGSPAKTLMSDTAAEPLRAWVAGGGALLMMHCACVACQTSAVLRKLAGGVFVGHPPAMSFQVVPMFTEHPIMAGIPAFTVFDEFYIERTEPDVQVHMVGTYQDQAYPMVWTRREERGRVVNIALGHDEKVWQLPEYRKLVEQSVAWLTEARQA